MERKLRFARNIFVVLTIECYTASMCYGLEKELLYENIDEQPHRMLLLFPKHRRCSLLVIL